MSEPSPIRTFFPRRGVLGALAGATATLALPVGAAQAESASRTAAAVAEDDNPDHALFGVWDAASGTWSVPARIDYVAAPTLAPVEQAVKAGDYAGAAKQLSEHFRKRSARTTLPYLYNGVFRPGLIPLFLDHIWTLGTGEILQDTVTVTGQEATVEADVTDALRRSYASGAASFFLMARHKETSTAVFASRSAESGQPALVVTHADGSTVTFAASADTYIKAGDDAKRVFGTEPVLEVRDEGTGAFGPETRKSYVAFELKGLTAAPKSAVLRLTGRNSTTADAKQVLVYQTLETFDETKRTWANTVQNTFSWQGDPGGFGWKGPAGSDPEYSYQLPRCYFAGPMADAYRKDGDEDVAVGLVGILRDFIHDADGYGTPYGAGSFPRSLDTANRIVNWIYAYEILRTSASLTPEANVELLRTIDKSGQYLTYAVNPTPNWMQAQKQALAEIALHFPELTESQAWLDNAGDFLAHQLSQALYPDGGYTESTDQYAHGVAATFASLMAYFAQNGQELAGKEDLRRLARFLADQNFPGGWGPSYGDSGTADRRPAFATFADVLDDDHLRYIATDGEKGTPPPYTSVLYPDTRVAVLRDGWRPDASYLRINADRGAHAHPDELAVTVYAHGRALLPNMGAFTYSGDPRSNWLRTTTESATTVEIDGRAQAPSSPASCDIFSTNAVFDVIRMSSDATSGVRHTRTVLFLRGRALWLVTDRLDPADSAPHTYRQNWHFLPDAHPSIAADSKATVTAFPNGANLRIVLAAPQQLTAQIRDGWYSPAFYNVSPAEYVTYSQQVTGTVGFDTLLMSLPENSTATATVERLPVAGTPDGSVSALSIRFGPHHAATYCLAHSTPRTPARFGPYGFDGTLAHVEQDGERQTWLLQGGRQLTCKDEALVTSPSPMGDVAVHLDPRARTVALTGTRLTPSTDPAASLHVRAPWARAVTLNGRAVPFARHGSMVLAAAPQ
jgi:hypothetical protein